MKGSKKVFILMLLLSIITTTTFSVNCKKENDYQMESTLELFVTRIYNSINTAFFNIDMLESIVKYGYDNLTEQEVEVLVTPIGEQYDVRNISILPKGIVEYVYPFSGNEKAIGDNIFLMPDRKIEAMIAINTKETILCGPYELTQGGSGLICRKAIYLPNQNGEDEFWGFVAIVLDMPEFISYVELPMLELYGYEYELSAYVNDIGKKIIQSSENFDAKKAIYADIVLPNGTWELGINKSWDGFEFLTIICIFLIGIFMSIAIFLYFQKEESQIEILNENIYTDYLTGVYNKKKLVNFFEQSKHAYKEYTIFYIDLNNFKHVNDTYGHETGDELLIAFVDRIKQIIRKDDMLVRVGGDEFVIILLNISCKEIIDDYYCRLKKQLDKVYIINEVEISSNASIGYAVYPTEGEIPEDLLSLADARMYEDKRKFK